MKTVAFYSNQEEAKILLLDGDMSRFDKVYINVGNSSLQDELNDILFDRVTGELVSQEISCEEAAKELKNDAKLIMCGFIL